MAAPRDVPRRPDGHELARPRAPAAGGPTAARLAALCPRVLEVATLVACLRPSAVARGTAAVTARQQLRGGARPRRPQVRLRHARLLKPRLPRLVNPVAAADELMEKRQAAA
jgi:hypothetical protein